MERLGSILLFGDYFDYIDFSYNELKNSIMKTSGDCKQLILEKNIN